MQAFLLAGFGALAFPDEALRRGRPRARPISRQSPNYRGLAAMVNPFGRRDKVPGDDGKDDHHQGTK
jgi:hypothetical protein